MVEVFKTNVENEVEAAQLITLIHQAYEGYHAHFALDDCEHILRIENQYGMVECTAIIRLLKEKGFFAAVLPDE